MATLCWQPLDDLHAAAALRTRRFPGVVVIGGGCLGTVLFDHCCVDTMIYGRGLLWRLSREKLADMGKLCLAMTIGKEAVVPDASEAVGQDVQEKSADELGRGQCHMRDARFVAVVLPGEGDMIVGGFDKTVIGDGNAVGIAAEVTQNLFGTGKGSLAVDHPVDPAERGKIGSKCLGVGQIHEI